jgi:FkbM family methyltransferase
MRGIYTGVMPVAPRKSNGMWESLLCFYGTRLPDHPGKRRTVLNLAHLMRKSWNVPRIAERRGINFELDLNDAIPRFLFYVGYYERWETRWLESALEPGWTVLDIGAHIGYYSLLCAKGVGPTGAVYAFEPRPSTFAQLRRNVELNPGLNVYPQAMAVSERAERLGLSETNSSNTGTSYITGKGSADSGVAATTLDEFVCEHGLTRVDFIKADVEGHEVKVLSGATQTLDRFRPRVMIELSPDALQRFGDTSESVIESLRSRGYLIYEATRRGLRLMNRPPDAGTYTTVIALSADSGRVAADPK